MRIPTRRNQAISGRECLATRASCWAHRQRGEKRGSFAAGGHPARLLRYQRLQLLRKERKPAPCPFAAVSFVGHSAPRSARNFSIASAGDFSFSTAASGDFSSTALRFPQRFSFLGQRLLPRLRPCARSSRHGRTRGRRRFFADDILFPFPIRLFTDFYMPALKNHIILSI